VLLEGSRNFRAPYLRPQAIHLLRRARTLSPWNFETVLELAQLLRRTDQREEARMLLEGLGQRSRGRYLRRVRKAELRLDPGISALWRLLRSGLGSQPDDASAVDSQGVVQIHSRRAQR
jgi:hypothetical protein